MSDAAAPYVPAAGHPAFTGFYDRIVAATMREDRWRPALVAAVTHDLAAGGSVVDVGAGTGTLALAMARARPDTRIVGVDGDPQALALAKRKPGAAEVTWIDGRAGRLPVEDGAADRVVLSLVLHHLPPDGKRAALAEARRVLRPGGSLHVADWGRPGGPGMRLAFLVLQLVDGFDGTREHAAGAIPSLVSDAGFGAVRRRGRLRTVWGALDLLSAERR